MLSEPVSVKTQASKLITFTFQQKNPPKKGKSDFIYMPAPMCYFPSQLESMSSTKVPLVAC